MTALPAADAVGLDRQFGLGPIDQVSFAVEDLDDVLPAYRAIFGDFTERTVTLNPERVTWRGRPLSATMRLAFARSGDVEIELVQVVDGAAPASEHIAAHGSGLHHVRFSVADHDAKIADLESAGFTTVMRGVNTSGTPFSYVEAPEQFGHTLFEVIERPLT